MSLFALSAQSVYTETCTELVPTTKNYAC